MPVPQKNLIRQEIDPDVQARPGAARDIRDVEQLLGTLATREPKGPAGR